MRTIEIDLKDPVQTLRFQRFAEKTGRSLSEAVEFFLEKTVAPYLESDTGTELDTEAGGRWRNRRSVSTYGELEREVTGDKK
jgi:hypothetical protein